MHPQAEPKKLKTRRKVRGGRRRWCRGENDVDVLAGVNDAGSVLGGGHGFLRRRWPWSAVKRLWRQGEFFPQQGAVASLPSRQRRRQRQRRPLVRDRLTDGAPVLRHAQHVPSAIVTEAETQRVVSLIHALDRPSLPRHMQLYHPNCGDAVSLAMVPSCSATTLSNEIFETGIKRTCRLLIELTPVTPSERRKCPVCHKESTCERNV